MMIRAVRKFSTRSTTTTVGSKSGNGGGAPTVHPTPPESEGLCLSPSMSCPSTSAAAASEDVGRELMSSRRAKDGASGSGRSGGEMVGSKCRYRTQLEEEILELQSLLEDELRLQAALATAVGDTAATPALLGSLSSHDTEPTVHDKTQQLLSSIKDLETRVSELEDELLSLHCLLRQERSERSLAEHRLRHPPSLTTDSSLPPHLSSSSSSNYSWDEQISSLRLSKYGQDPLPQQPDCLAASHIVCGNIQDQLENPGSPLSEQESGGTTTLTKQNDIVDYMADGLSLTDTYPDHDMFSEEMQSASVSSPTKEEDGIGSLQPQLSVRRDWSGLSLHPNSLSEEMVYCMRNIFLCLSGSSKAPHTRGALPNQKKCPSPLGHLSYSSLTSLSGSFSSNEFSQFCENTRSKGKFDPYGIQSQGHQTCIGVYSVAVEVSWMTVGKKQLEYAAEALQRFRYLVEQLSKVNPSHLNSNERLAFWINLYNALIMHAYLAYGVPRNDLKHFSLMQKASYKVGQQSFSAAEIEYVILKMKPPAYRPQTALVLTLHKFKITEEHLKYSVDVPEPLVAFALSCGLYSSPAVRIYTAENIKKQLHLSLRDYIRASVNINDKGKLLVPKLLHCFAKGIVEDSLLVDWICRFLLPEQISLVRDSASQWRHRLLGARSFIVIPFISRFRYLFLPDKDFFSPYITV